MRSPDLAAEILRYLDAHPHAIDSIGGIASQWLCSRDDLAQLEQALDRLAEQGLIERIVLTNGSVVYGKLATVRA